MRDFTNSNQDKQSLRHNAKPNLDLIRIIPVILRKWYWFVLTILIALFGARSYIKHTMPVYRSSSTILVNETEDRPVVDNTDLLQGLGLPGGMRNLQNQIMILKSQALTERTLKELPFTIDFYTKTIRNKLPIYPDVPFRIISDSEIPLPKDTEIAFSVLDSNTFILECKEENFQFNRIAKFGDEIIIPWGSFSIVWISKENISESTNKEIWFQIHSPSRLVNYFNKRLNVERISREGSLLMVSLEGTNSKKDVDFINTHLAGFQEMSLNKKNEEADRRVQFIDGQLVGVSDSLSITETRLQQFRSSHRVMDLSAQGQSIIGQVTLLENERAKLSLEANYYDYLADYLNKETSTEVPIIPITMGITDPGLARLVEELAELQGQLATRGTGELNPLQRHLEQRINATKNALKETLNGLRRANSLARSENQEQINRTNTQASSLPVTERQLLGIERKFKLNDELYTFLLQARAEQEMQKASNRADSEIIDPADIRYSTLVSPNRLTVFSIALFLGFVIPLLIIYLNLIFNNKLKDDDIEQIAKFPIVGRIPHNSKMTETIVFDDPESTIAEAYRILRSRMQFFTKQIKAPVILVTSAMPEDGKTFTAINLASVYSLLGKKTILIGFDLRKPKIFQDFNLKNENGVSTWLIGTTNLDSIIQKTAHENFSIISAGPVPPNPSELTALEKTSELIAMLREKYDCIIIDSSPIGVVSDTFHLASLADACILVVRPGKTLRDQFSFVMSELDESNIRGLGLVINDVRANSKHYGYGGNYGYTNDKKNNSKRLFTKSKRK